MTKQPAGKLDIKSRLRNGEQVRGLFLTTHDATLCEFVALLGWDFLLMDGEHGPVTAHDMENVARACERRGVAAMARVPMSAPAEVGRLLDAGAVAIMAPRIESRQEAAQVVELVKYPPQGRRGLGAGRAANFGLECSLPEEIDRANEDTLTIVQIESVRGLDAVEDIAAVDGIDVVFLGPADLSLALGIPMQWDAPEFITAAERVASATRHAGKVFGAYAGTRDQISWFQARGATLIAVALEDVLILGSQTLKE